MRALQQFEKGLEGAVEGFFARAFRSGLQPIELAKAVQRYAADNQHVTSDGVVVPNVYRVQVSAKDHERLSNLGTSLPRELARMVVTTAADRGWQLRGPVKVRVELDDRVRVGRYQLSGRVEAVESGGSNRASAMSGRPAADGPRAIDPDEASARPVTLRATSAAGAPADADDRPATASSRPGEPAGEAEPAVGASPSPATPLAGTVGAAAAGSAPGRPGLEGTQLAGSPPPTGPAVRVLSGPESGQLVPLPTQRSTLGRLSTCTVTVTDTTVSREHAAIVRRGERWWIIDLGSTNGTRVNGVRAAEQPVAAGDRINLGDAILEFVGG